MGELDSEPAVSVGVLDEMKQKVIVVGKRVVRGNEVGTIIEQTTPLEFCELHGDCLGPTCRIRWNDGRVRKECLYVLLRKNGFRLEE